MAKKKEIKTSEARILIYLSQVQNIYKNVANISRKLDIDYVYCSRILKGMKEKGWLQEIRKENKTFYEIRRKEMLEKAKQELAK